MARLRTVVASALAGRFAWELLNANPPGGRERWERTNHRGDTITLLEGPAFTIAAALGAGFASGLPARLRLAATVATVGAGAMGALDDLTEQGKSKGLKGHLGALAQGQVTTGALKIAGIGASGLIAAALINSRDSKDRSLALRAVDTVLSGALIAGTANLFNLLDLRPGRALKAGMLSTPIGMASSTAGPLLSAALGASAAVLPEDLDEKAMLGDTGANALGALVGTAAVTSLGPIGRGSALAVVVGLTLASEKVSFSEVIAQTPVLRDIDEWGRLPRE